MAGSCIRIYLKWYPRKEPCKADSGENPQILFNTTCWGIGKACYNAMEMGSVHNYHMTSVESKKQDIFIVKFKKQASVMHANKFETDWMNMPHFKARERERVKKKRQWLAWPRVFVFSEIIIGTVWDVLMYSGSSLHGQGHLQSRK
ncbi:unnamed protein product [Effrenium voratum]|uniref:Uncharacterized protein n=1 Tax=Effrenium voratum TaxID=2562239 RepID=A0AA36NDW0_9DINO|nr:unnamed protein product [Effrenium voratum]